MLVELLSRYVNCHNIQGRETDGYRFVTFTFRVAAVQGTGRNRRPRTDTIGDMKIVCPGSYDPVTSGHIDVFARGLRFADEVVAAVVHNPNKSGTFPVDRRVELIRAGLEEDPRTAQALVDGRLIIDDVAGGLLVDYCTRIGATAVLKGLRSATDFAYELPMAHMNRHLTDLETVFIPGDPKFEHVSSSLIREVHALGGDVGGLVPTAVLRALDELREQRAQR